MAIELIDTCLGHANHILHCIYPTNARNTRRFFLLENQMKILQIKRVRMKRKKVGQNAPPWAWRGK